MCQVSTDYRPLNYTVYTITIICQHMITKKLYYNNYHNIIIVKWYSSTNTVQITKQLSRLMSSRTEERSCGLWSRRCR